MTTHIVTLVDLTGIYPITTLRFSCKPLHFHSSVTIISKSVHATISILKTQAMASCSNLWSPCLKHENQTQHMSLHNGRKNRLKTFSPWEWSLMQTIGFGWLSCTSAGSSTVRDTLLWRGEADIGGSWVYAGGGGTCAIPLLSPQFCCKP